MFEIYGYGNVDALLGIFNAIAALRGSGDFLTAIAAVVVVGFFAAMLAYALQPEKMTGWKWLASVLGVYYLLWVPTATVQVLDKQGFQPPVVVANVPFGAAALGGISSSVGSVVTDMFETVFSSIPGPAAMPNELSYSQAGMMFGARAVAEGSRAAFLDNTFKTNLNNFLLNCTFYDLQDPAGINPTAWNNSTDLWALMATTNPARFTPFLGSAGSVLRSCPDAYGLLAFAIDAATDQMRERLANTMLPSVPVAVRNTIIDPSITQAYLKNALVSSSVSVTELLRQNALVNAVVDAGLLGCQRSNDPACIMQAQSRANATATTNAAWISGAKVAEQALPLIRNTAESMLYAMFPIVVLMLFLSTGMKTFRMLGLYVALFVSIQLWPPLFAILNYLGTQAASTQLAAAGTIVGGTFGVSLQTSDAIYSNAVSMPAVVSYLVMSIPILAYAIANGLVGVSGALFGAVSSIQSSVAGAAGPAAVGSMSMGMMAMDQRNVTTTTSSPFVVRSQNAQGDWVTTTSSGTQATEFLRNQGAASRVISSRVSQSAVNESSRAAETARSELFAASSEYSAVLTDTMSRASSMHQSTSRSDGQSVSSVSEMGQSADRLRTISDSVAKTTGLTSGQVAQLGFQLSGGVGMPSISPIKGGAIGSAGKHYSSGLTEAEQKAVSQLTADQLREFKSFADRASRDKSFMQALGSESRQGKELASRLGESVSRVESAQASYSERQAVADRLSTSYERGEVLSVDLAQLPTNSEFMRRYHQLAAQYGSDSAALHAAMASELATHSLMPTRISGAAALPSTFADVRSAHGTSLNDPAFARDRVSGADSANDRTVGPMGLRRGIEPPAVGADLQGVRSEVSGRTSAAAASPSSSDTFDARNEIVRNPDGTVTTRRSAGVGNIRQLRDDAHNIYENTKEILDSASAEDALEAAEAARARQQASPRGQAIEATPEVPSMRPNGGRRKSR
jgi:conjugal transfer mating pair stabilization protein TraG